jgi:hypothetical protein
MNLLVVALAVLLDASTSLALRAAAAEALRTAAEHGLDLPHGAPLALWRWLCSTLPTCGWQHARQLGEMPDPVVTSEAIKVLSDGDAGAELQGLAVELLSGSAHAQLVTDDVLLGYVERGHAEEAARHAARLAVEVQRVRRVGRDVLLQLRDRLAASGTAAVRATSIDVAMVMPLDVNFIRRMLHDEAAEVRQMVASHVALDITSTPDVEKLINERLALEQVADVRADLLRAAAALEHDGLDRPPRRGRPPR